jgi:hypothetical protein
MASQEVITALESLHREIEKLEPAIKHVETAQQVTQTVKAIPQKHVELLTEVKNNDAKHKEELKNIFAKELSAFTEENKRLQKTTAEIQQQVKLEIEALANLREIVQTFHDRVEKINFPERLDKLDANVAGIMAAVQAVQSRLDLVEGNVKERIKDLLEHEKGTRTKLTALINESKADILASIKSTSQRQQIFTYVSWGLILAGFVILFLTFKQ